MMQRRWIALMMLAAYLMVAVGGAVVSLTCSCHLYRHSESKHTHCCCENHLHDRGHLHMDEACACLHDHSTDIDLYTSPLEDQERDLLRVVVLQLPADLVPQPTLFTLRYEREALHYDPPLLLLTEPLLGALSFRAPPVVA